MKKKKKIPFFKYSFFKKNLSFLFYSSIFQDLHFSFFSFDDFDLSFKVFLNKVLIFVKKRKKKSEMKKIPQVNLKYFLKV